MKLKVFGSSSKGNGYALTDSKGNTLLIECGVKFSEVKEYLDFDLSRVVGCLLTHEHGDHIKYVGQYLQSGIDVAMSNATALSSGLKLHHRTKIVMAERKYSEYYAPFSFMPVDMVHDVPTFGFIVQHPEMGNMLFMTDSYYSPFKFSNINHWIVECNYSEELLDQNTGSKKFLRDRIMSSHLSLENLLKMLRANDLSKTQNIILTHLSDRNSNEIEFIEKVKNATGKKVYAADIGREFTINKTPF